MTIFVSVYILVKNKRNSRRVGARRTISTLMAKEIERKFLVTDSSYKLMAKEVKHIMQAYLNRDPRSTVRVRITGDKAV